MALSIKSAEADRLARQVAALTGESLTEAITTALRQRFSQPSSSWYQRLLAAASRTAMSG